MGLTEIARESAGKTSHEMKNFFGKMVKQGNLQAYLVELDKQVVEKDTQDEQLVRTKKGVTLTPTKKLSENCQVIVEDPETGTRYFLSMGSRGGEFYDDGDSQTIYHDCTLERLSERFNPRKLTRCFEGRIAIPERMVSARLRMSYSEDWKSGCDSDYIASTTGQTVIEGERDSLFTKICEFVKG
jgi:hypothetical protein